MVHLILGMSTSPIGNNPNARSNKTTNNTTMATNMILLMMAGGENNQFTNQYKPAHIPQMIKNSMMPMLMPP